MERRTFPVRLIRMRHAILAQEVVGVRNRIWHWIPTTEPRCWKVVVEGYLAIPHEEPTGRVDLVEEEVDAIPVVVEEVFPEEIQ